MATDTAGNLRQPAVNLKATSRSALPYARREAARDAPLVVAAGWLPCGMGNPEHVAKLTEGVEAWSRWREENPDVIPDLTGEDLSNREGSGCFEAQLEGADFRVAHLEGAKLIAAQLEGANFFEAHLKEANFLGAQLKEANFFEAQLEGANFGVAHLEGAELIAAQLKEAKFSGAQLKGANLLGAQLEGANLLGAQLKGANLRSADLSNADLRDVRGLRFDDTKILRARLTAQPGTFWKRLLPWFILSPLTDPWSTLRRTYTGPNFIIALIALIAFLLPYVFEALAWRSVNTAQTLMRSAASELADRHDMLAALADLEPCLASACETYAVWYLLLAGNRGWLAVVLTGAVIIYNMLRFYLTKTVMAYREEEERSGFTPAWLGKVFNADAESVGTPWLRLHWAALGYEHLVWCHIALQVLLWIVIVAFFTNLGSVLLLSVELPAPWAIAD